MNPASVPPIVMAGLAFYVGHYHLLIFVKRRSHREDLYFALTCFATCAYDLLCAGLYDAASAQAGAWWQRGQFIALACFTTSFLWFAAEYTGLKRRLPVFLFTAFFAAALLIQAVDRSQLTWVLTDPSIKEILLPFGLRVTYYEARLGWFTTIQGLSGLAASTFIFFLAVRFYRHGPRGKAGPLLIPMAVLYLAAINDTAVSQDLYRFIYLIEYSYLVLIMFVSFSLSRVVVAGAMAEERFRALVETTADWVWEVDRGLRYTYCSPKVKEMLGYEPGELIGTSPLALMPAEEARRLEPVIRELQSSGRPMQHLENQALAKDGRLVHLETSAEAFFDENGNLRGYRGIDRDISGRLQAEGALRESETLFRTLVESSPAGIFMVDDAFAFRYVNDETSRILGYARQELEGMDFRSVLDEDSRELVAERYRRRQQGEVVVSRYEVGIRRKDGTRRRLEMVATAVNGADGRMRTMGQILDITERLRTEEALRQAHAVVLRSPVVLFRWQAAPGWPVELVSENVIRFGYTPEELLNGTVQYTAMVHPEDVERVAREVAQHAASGRSSFQQEYRLLTRSGEVRWVDDRMVVERNAEGQVSHFQGILMDITERKLLERETEERRAFLESILAAAPDAIVTADDRHAIREWNPGAQRLFGYSRQEAIGRQIDELVTGGDERIAAEAARWTRSLDQGQSIPLIETTRYRQDGRPIDVLVSVAPILAGTQRVGVVAIYTDIGEQKRAEKEILRLNADLELRVQQRTAELQAVNKELEAFAHSVSHDLRAPLRAMEGFSRALQEDCGNLLDATGSRYVNHIRGASKRMGELIDGLLSLSRITRSEIRLQRVDLSALGREIAEALARRDDTRRVEFRIADGLEGQCDQRLMRAALENLLENAWKFTAGRERARIEFGRESSGGEPAFFVRDNGAGFDMAYAAKLFQPFQRLHREEEFPGIGLGLANVQRIVRRHGGRVWAEGRIDGGAAFWFTLAAAGENS
jgi:PAS domain S-box-containing protein